jgi:hypothetical protein
VSGGTKPSYTRQQFIMLRRMLEHDAVGIAWIAEEIGLTRQTVYPNPTHQTRRSPKVQSVSWYLPYEKRGCSLSLR